MLSALDQQLVKLKNPAEYTPALLLSYSEALEKYQSDAQQQAALLAAMASSTGRKINDQDNLMTILNNSVHGQFLDCLDDFTKLQQKFQALLSSKSKKSSGMSSLSVAAPAPSVVAAAAADVSPAADGSPDGGDKKKNKKKKKSPTEQKEQKQQAVSDGNQK